MSSAPIGKATSAPLQDTSAPRETTLWPLAKDTSYPRKRHFGHLLKILRPLNFTSSTPALLYHMYTIIAFWRVLYREMLSLVNYPQLTTEIDHIETRFLNEFCYSIYVSPFDVIAVVYVSIKTEIHACNGILKSKYYTSTISFKKLVDFAKIVFKILYLI